MYMVMENAVKKFSDKTVFRHQQFKKEQLFLEVTPSQKAVESIVSLDYKELYRRYYFQKPQRPFELLVSMYV